MLAAGGCALFVGSAKRGTRSSPVAEKRQRWRPPHPVAGPRGRAVRAGESLCTILPVLSELVLRMNAGVAGRMRGGPGHAQ